MTLHHHHFYDDYQQPAFVEHDHATENVRHNHRIFGSAYPVYWDHEGTDCDGIEEQP